MIKLFSVIISWVLIVAPLSGLTQTPTKFQTDILQFGRASSSVPKNLIFDTGDAGLNKMLSLDNITKQFSMNSTLNVTGGVSATGNISTSAGNISASGSATVGSLDVTGTARHRSGSVWGNGTDASRQVTVDRAGFDPFLKWNETTDKWVFSNDGSVEKNFGSGSGGDAGINILLNPSFEDGIVVDWVNSGGTFTSQPYATPDPTGNNTVFARFVATTSGQFFETALKTVPSNVFGGCLAKINFNTTDSANWMLRVFDSSSNLLAEQPLGARSWQDGVASFPCPTVGTQIKLRVASLGAGQIEGDLAYLGKENRTFQVAQAQIAGESYFAGNSACLLTRSSATVGAFTPDADCTGPTITDTSMGSWQTTDADLLRQTINNLPAGKYRAKFSTWVFANGSARAGLAITDGTTTCEPIHVNQAMTGILQDVECVFNYATSGNRTFELLGGVSTGTLSIANDHTAPRASSKFSLTFFPNSSQTALVPEAQDWFVDANLFATTNLTLPNSSSYVELANSDITLDVTEGSGVQIPCSGTNPSTGVTCAVGNESLGLYVRIPEAGRYMICGEFMTSINNNQNVGLQWVETTNNTQTIIQEGKSRAYSGHNIGVGGLNNTQIRCGIFRFTSAGFRTLRLMAEGTSSNSVIVLDRSASFGQPDLHVWMMQLSSAVNRPYLTGDQVTSKNMTKPKLCSFAVTAAGAISNPLGCTPTVGSYSGGTLAIAFSGEWSGAPNCTCTTLDNQGTCSESSATSPSSTNFDFITRTVANATSNVGAFIICHGQGN